MVFSSSGRVNRVKGTSLTYHDDDEIEPTPSVREVDLESQCQEFD